MYCSFFRNYRIFLIGLFSFIIAGISSQIIKIFFASDALRPANFFHYDELHFVEGVEISYYNSFPSGHTATAFAVFMFLAFVYRNNKFGQVFLGILACLVGYSRTYLSQHFLIDVACGALIGIGSFLIAFRIFNNATPKWLDSSVMKSIQKTKNKN